MSMVLLSTQTASNSSTIVIYIQEFDSTYKEYIFKFIDIHAIHR